MWSLQAAGLMGCNCGRSASGAAIVWQYHEPGKEPRTFASKTEAEAARTRAGGRGPIIRTTQAAR